MHIFQQSQYLHMRAYNAHSSVWQFFIFRFFFTLKSAEWRTSHMHMLEWKIQSKQIRNNNTLNGMEQLENFITETEKKKSNNNWIKSTKNQIQVFRFFLLLLVTFICLYWYILDVFFIFVLMLPRVNHIWQGRLGETAKLQTKPYWILNAYSCFLS